MHKLLVVAVYRPPASAIGSFLDEFADLLERVTTYSSVVIVGDLNIHLDVDTDPGVVKFQSLLAVNNYIQHVAVATHVARLDLLDVVY